MSRYKSEQIAHDPRKKKNVPLWRLDTNTLTVTYFNTDTLAEEYKNYCTDYIRYIFIIQTASTPTGFAGSSTMAISNSTLMIYLKVSEAISRKQTDSYYQKAVLSGDTKKMLGLENCFVYMAREAVFDCMVYI